MDIGFLVIIVTFLIYYFSLVIIERKLVSEPKDIIDKFFSVTLTYAGISLIYFSITGQPFLTDSESSYNVYIFIIGFVAVLWAIPHLLKEFKTFRSFFKIKKKK
ncbi:hypothetical protein HN681_00935 [archaeon]|jgi:hypothetical protein|nr:hypothetical protein [archaeon]MBT3730820.1 hypothetical protein [archaeon]MBT4670134.1 hypothetical protein [archaeon]MBT5030576.1 hypothetical protein [archaeon]MBT5287929.1 hypothetical protein [archaeon]